MDKMDNIGNIESIDNIDNNNSDYIKTNDKTDDNNDNYTNYDMNDKNDKNDNNDRYDIDNVADNFDLYKDDNIYNTDNDNDENETNNVDNSDNSENSEKIEKLDKIDKIDSPENYINITDFMDIKERLEKIESLIQKLNSFKSSLSNHKIFLYDSLHELKKEKVRFDRITRPSLVNIYNSMTGKFVAEEKNIRIEFVSGKNEYEKLRQSAENIKYDINLIENEIESERGEIARLKNQNKRSMSYIDYMYETGRKSFLNTTYEQQISDLKNKEKEVLEIIDIGKKLICSLNESLENIIKADNYWNDMRKDFINIQNVQTALHRILFGEAEKNAHIRKAGIILYHLADTLKSFTAALYNINQNQLSYIAEYEIKDYDIALNFIDYFRACISEDMRNKKDFKTDCGIMENLRGKINKIIEDLEELKSIITEKLEHLYAERKQK